MGPSRHLAHAARLVFACLLVLGACSDGSPAGAPTSTAAPVGPVGPDNATAVVEATVLGRDLTRLRAALPPTVEVAVALLAIERDEFESASLNIVVGTVPDGRAAILGTVDGTYQLGYASAPEVLRASAAGLPLRIVAAGPTLGPTDHTALVTRNRELSGYASLVGGAVAVTDLGGLDHLAMLIALHTAAVDPTSVEFIAMGPSRSLAALIGGEVDAAMVPEPFLSAAVDDRGAFAPSRGSEDLRIIGRPRQELDLPIQQGYWFTTADQLTDTPGEFAAFARVLAIAGLTARDLPDVARRLAAETFGVASQPNRSPTRANMVEWSSAIDRLGLEQTISLMSSYGLLRNSTAGPPDPTGTAVPPSGAVDLDTLLGPVG